MKSSSKFFVAYLIFFSGLVLLLLLIRPTVSLGSIPTRVSPAVTERSPIMAVAREDVVCYFGENWEYQIIISKLVIVGILEKNGGGDLVKVRLNELIDCWVPLSSLELNNISLESVPFANISLIISTRTAIPIITPILVNVIATPPSPLLIRWKILSYDCDDGKAVGATIDLDVSGGVPEYNFSPRLPIYAKPGQSLSITVKSKTIDGEPSGVIIFTIPSGTDKTQFQCELIGNGNVPLPPPPPTEEPPTAEQPTTEPPTAEPPTAEPPTAEPVCYNPQGKVIPCHEK